MTETLSADGMKIAKALGWQPPSDFRWTHDVVDKSLIVPDPVALVEQVHDAVRGAKLVIPDAEAFIRRCVVALMAGHVVLQGPPGTGKTTFSRILAKAFDAQLRITTATAEWSTYDVVGGLRPTDDGTLTPTLGAVSSAALQCAELVRDEPEQREAGTEQAVWLLIDELNRADIDKAVGPLYTVLSSTTSAHLQTSPLELWFEEGLATKLWIPSRFRIIGTMNDADTSFVNSISQGLTRRFQFVYMGVPLTEELIADEIAAASNHAVSWVHDQYKSLGDELDKQADAHEDGLTASKALLGKVLSFLRGTDGDVRWPVGSAQAGDVWRAVLLGLLARGEGGGGELKSLLDDAVAHRLVPQGSNLGDDQLASMESWMSDNDLTISAQAVRHLRDTRSSI